MRETYRRWGSLLSPLAPSKAARILELILRAGDEAGHNVSRVQLLAEFKTAFALSTTLPELERRRPQLVGVR